MSVEMIKEYYARQGYDQHIHMFLALQCAPLLKGLSNSSLVSLDRKMMRSFHRTIKETKLQYCILYRGGKRYLIFLYNSTGLLKHLTRAEVLERFCQYGYPADRIPEEKRIEELCNILAGRMEQYYRKEMEFPHEIGYFLEYPLEDVDAFIGNRGKDSLLSGYWKVYQDVAGAKECFRRYDMAREEVVSQVLSGRKIKEIVA